MSWPPDQRQRLGIERRLLAGKFPTLEWVNPGDPASTSLQGPMKTNSGHIYQIGILVPSAYPATCPDLLVLRPAPLRTRNGSLMPDVSAEMHTLGRTGDYTRICHFQPALWTPENTLYLVAMKGRIWLEAYEAHLRSGLPLDRFLRHMGASADTQRTLTPTNPEEGIFLRLLKWLK